MFRMLQEGGWPAMLALFVGILALLAAGGALVSLGFSKRAAFVVGVIALALASLAAIVGALGVAWGHVQVERALGGVIDNQAMRERILAMGYREAGNCGTVGFAVAILPLLLGGIAALVGSRARPPEVVPHFGPMDAFRGPSPPMGPPPGPGMGRTLAALGAVGFTLLCALAALATSFSRPPPGKYALELDDESGWRVAEARATLEIPGKYEDGCDELDEALSSLRISSPREVPPRFSRDPDAIAPGTRAEATRCARDVFERVKKGSAARKATAPSYAVREWTREELLVSPLLVDAALRREIDGWAPPKPAGQLSVGSDTLDSGPSEAAVGLSPAEIRAIVTTHSAEVRFCYEQALARRPKLAGTLRVEMAIGPKGDVTSATVTSSTLGDAEMDDCVVRKVKAWRFPAPRGGGVVKVGYPFRFEPK